MMNIEIMQFQAEEYIIKNGQNPTHVYFLALGECEVLVRDHTKKEKFVREISQGQMFGEVALLYKTRRTASVKSKNNLCTVGGLHEEYFYQLIKNFPEIEQKMIEQARNEYDDHWKKFQILTLGKIEYLRYLPQNVLDDMHYQLTVENYEKGAKIIQRGTDC